MKHFLATFTVLALFSGLVQADTTSLIGGLIAREGHIPRSLDEKLNGTASIDVSTTVSLGQGIEAFSSEESNNNLRTQLKLTSSHSAVNNPDNFSASQLRSTEAGTGNKRSIVKMSPEDLEKYSTEIKSVIDKKIGKNGYSQYMILGNFVHHVRPSAEQSFFILVVPKSAQVEKVIFQVEWFGNGTGAHNQIRMIFDQPFFAIQQELEADSATLFDIANDQGKADIVYSLQTARLEGGKTEWSATDGLLGEYANTLQFYSIQSKAKRQIYGSYIEQWELTGLTASQKQAIFETSVEISDTLGDTTIYNTVVNSCITHAYWALMAGGRGVSSIDPMWFNPFSNVNRMKAAGVQMTPWAQGGLNDEFKQYAQYAPEGGKVLSYEDIVTAQKEGNIFPLRYTLLQSTAFEDLVKKLAVYLIEKEITSSQVDNFVGKVQGLLANNEDPSSSDDLSETEQDLFKKIKQAWIAIQASVVGELQKPEVQSLLQEKGIELNLSSLGLNDVLTALGAIKTQQ